MPERRRSPSAARRHVEVYGALLVLYPREFRRDYGPAMVQLFRDQLSHRAGGRAARVWPRALRDLLLSAPLQRMEVVMSRSRSVAWLSLASLVPALTFAVLVGGVSDPVAFLAALGLALACEAAIVVLAMLYRRAVLRPAEAALRDSPVRHWWAVVAAVLAVAGLAAMIAQLAGEPSGENIGHLALGALFCGLIAAGLVVRVRRAGPLGNWLVVAGLTPFLLVFWFPPVPLAALLALIGAIAEAGRGAGRHPTPVST